MNRHKTDLLGALLDGELKGFRRWRLVRHLRACPLCAAEYRKVRGVRRMLKKNPPIAAMSDSAEFFWSKVRNEIDRRSAETLKIPAPSLSPADWFGLHRFALASVAAAFVAAVGVFWLMQGMSRPAYQGDVKTSRQEFAQVEQVATEIPNTVATVLDAEKAGVTVIWISGLPWTSDMNEMKTRYANMDI